MCVLWRAYNLFSFTLCSGPLGLMFRCLRFELFERNVPLSSKRRECSLQQLWNMIFASKLVCFDGERRKERKQEENGREGNRYEIERKRKKESMRLYWKSVWGKCLETAEKHLLLGSENCKSNWKTCRLRPSLHSLSCSDVSNSYFLGRRVSENKHHTSFITCWFSERILFPKWKLFF